MFIFYSLLESAPEIFQTPMDVQEPDFGLNGTRLPKNEWKSISIRNIHSVGVGGMVWLGKNTDWLVTLGRKRQAGRKSKNRLYSCVFKLMLFKNQSLQK